MPARSDITDPRASDELVRALRAFFGTASADLEAEPSIGVVHARGGQTEFDLGAALVASPDPLDRITGCRVLAQLGWGDRTFLAESVEALLPLLRDPVARVVKEALFALSHRHDPATIPAVLPFSEHSDADLRYAAVIALSRYEDPAAVAALIQLSSDEDADVRNWATFGLGTQVDFDSPALRDALAARRFEADEEIRGEALIGLAKRQDPRALGAIAAELSGEFWGSWCLEAAELLAHPDLYPLLVRCRERAPEADRLKFAIEFDRAEVACQPKA
ncbi:MAG: HEAT repeat domain-containing protein [Verrucomicrobia bacterium]|nr:HEAT repeat domain-containing protein [Verrucomicrobiota bacterium]